MDEVHEISNIIGSIVVKLKELKANLIKEQYVKYDGELTDDPIENLKILSNSEHDKNLNF